MLYMFVIYWSFQSLFFRENTHFSWDMTRTQRGTHTHTNTQYNNMAKWFFKSHMFPLCDAKNSAKDPFCLAQMCKNYKAKKFLTVLYFSLEIIDNECTAQWMWTALHCIVALCVRLCTVCLAVCRFILIWSLPCVCVCLERGLLFMLLCVWLVFIFDTFQFDSMNLFSFQFNFAPFSVSQFGARNYEPIFSRRTWTITRHQCGGENWPILSVSPILSMAIWFDANIIAELHGMAISQP